MLGILAQSMFVATRMSPMAMSEPKSDRRCTWNEGIKLKRGEYHKGTLDHAKTRPSDKT